MTEHDRRVALALVPLLARHVEALVDPWARLAATHVLARLRRRLVGLTPHPRRRTMLNRAEKREFLDGLAELRKYLAEHVTRAVAQAQALAIADYLTDITMGKVKVGRDRSGPAESA
jgi:hypothetical protein